MFLKGNEKKNEIYFVTLDYKENLKEIYLELSGYDLVSNKYKGEI